MKKTKKAASFFVGMFLLIVAWQAVVTIGKYEEALLPGPLSVMQAFIGMTLDGSLFLHLKDSLFRFGAGYLAAAVPAVLAGILLGRSNRIWAIIDPVVQVLRPISPVAWSPFIVLWFGIGNMPAIAVIFIAAFFPILLATVNGVRNVDEHYLKIAANLQFNKLAVLKKIIFPAALPAIISGLHIAIGTAWIFLVAGEMIGAQSGLGYLIVDARNTLDLDIVLAGIATIGICGFLLDRFIAFGEFLLKKYSGFLL